MGGKKEGEGPIGKHLDLIVEDPMFGKENWEESESCFLKTAGEIALRKGKKKKKDVRMAFCGDLLGQLIASSFGIAELEIPYYGVYCLLYTSFGNHAYSLLCRCIIIWML